jgi:peptide methionine sulfoxide reductase MsrA
MADYHQQYLAKNPDGYRGIGGCGVPFKSAEVELREQA